MADELWPNLLTKEQFDRLFPKAPAVDPKFTAWMAKVDAIIEARFGLTSSDLPDFMYCDAFEDGATPRQAAAAAIKSAGE